MSSLRLGALAAAVLAAAGLAAADDKAQTGFVNKTFKNADGTESPYVVFVPRGYDGTKAVPVVLFLHGSGETKGDKSGKMPAEVGIGPAVKKREKTFPAIVVIPQSEKRTWQADRDDGKRALAILDEVARAYKTDPKRVYLTGLSMGGFGTWSIAAAHPDKWAAIVPVCGGVSGGPKAYPEVAGKIKDIPTWVFHGDQDSAVPVKFSRDLVAALRESGGKPKYTEYKGVGHNSWDKAYGETDLWAWLFEQKKK
ncbi:MAG: prolyl oligopeptidase family serine peptidase [Gemmataceae bacterium]|nr:prolyl oligopeptidase family serine peptidase [Gemmataceae bacterium]